MAGTISTYLKAIREAVYGKDVREAIANGIECCYSNVNASVTLADEKISTMNEKINTASEKIKTMSEKITEAGEKIDAIDELVTDKATPYETMKHLGLDN